MTKHQLDEMLHDLELGHAHVVNQNSQMLAAEKILTVMVTPITSYKAALGLSSRCGTFGVYVISGELRNLVAFLQPVDDIEAWNRWHIGRFLAQENRGRVYLGLPAVPMSVDEQYRDAQTVLHHVVQRGQLDAGSLAEVTQSIWRPYGAEYGNEIVPLWCDDIDLLPAVWHVDMLGLSREADLDGTLIMIQADRPILIWG